MKIIVKHTQTVSEFKEEQIKLKRTAQMRYADHMTTGTWIHGEPICVWRTGNDSIMVEYQDGYAE